MPIIFFTDEYNDMFYNICLNNIHIIEQFCNYFDEKSKYIIGLNDKKNLAFFDNKIKIFSTYQENICTQKIESFLQEAFIEKRLLKTREKDITLSKREIECLNYLSLGKTMKEIARVLDLSPRSVEFYLQNIKKKSGLNRGELIAHFASNFSICNSYSDINK